MNYTALYALIKHLHNHVYITEQNLMYSSVNCAILNNHITRAGHKNVYLKLNLSTKNIKNYPNPLHGCIFVAFFIRKII